MASREDLAQAPCPKREKGLDVRSAFAQWNGVLAGSRFRRGALAAVVTAALGSTLVWGAWRLERVVASDPRFQTPAEYVWMGQPADGIRELLTEHLGDLVDEVWRNPGLCPRIDERLSENAWVRGVRSVRRCGDGVIEIDCDYRQPIAVVQEGSNFILVSDDGVRLPGSYGSSADLPVIQGSRGPLPWAGEAFKEGDVTAGIALARLIEREEFREQVLAVRVDNYDGRLDRKESHVELASDRMGGRILWGSAPGREVEENTVEEKLAILRHNYETTGRLDAHYAVIDISTYPDRFIARE